MRENASAKNKTPLKAIRAKCLECQDGNYKNVRKCEFTNCPLFAFRLGKHPARQGQGRLSNFAKTTPHLGEELQQKNGIPGEVDMAFCEV